MQDTTHDFDAVQRERQQKLVEQFGDHQFTLRGETFKIRRIIPVAVLRSIVGIRADSPDHDAFETTYRAVMAMLASDDDRQRLDALLDDVHSEFPVTYNDLLEVQWWIVAEASGRPPTQPASSSPSPSTNGTSATDGSSEPPDGA